MARPTKFDPRFIKQAYEIALLGATDEDYARIFEVDVSTISNWKINYPKFLEAIKKGKDVADAQVAKSLFKRANGYSHPDVDIKVIDGKIVITKLIKHYPPDATSAIFWLKNRQKENWRDQSNIDHTTKGKELPAPILQGLSVRTDNSDPEVSTS